MSALEKDFTIKIIILFLATLAGIFAIWFALIRQESADWLVGQVAHQVSPYAVSETSDGAIITNVVADYAFTLPPGFKTTGSRNLSFYLEQGGEKKCETRHRIEGGNFVFELIDESEISICGRYLKKIKNSVIF